MTLRELNELLGLKGQKITFKQRREGGSFFTTIQNMKGEEISIFTTKDTAKEDITADCEVEKINGKWFIGVAPAIDEVVVSFKAKTSAKKQKALVEDDED